MPRVQLFDIHELLNYVTSAYSQLKRPHLRWLRMQWWLMLITIVCSLIIFQYNQAQLGDLKFEFRQALTNRAVVRERPLC